SQPKQLEINAVSGAALKLEADKNLGVAGFYTVYGPKAKVELKGADLSDPTLETTLYGAVIAEELKMDKGAALFYDLDLPGTPTGGGGTVVILSRDRL
ncbi:MAG: hypothetical protein AB1758_15805, partial [Candidatus Eremiobacterota bacterium]